MKMVEGKTPMEYASHSTGQAPMEYAHSVHIP